MPQRPSAPYVRLRSPAGDRSPVPSRFTKMAPTRERFGSSRETRTTAKLLAGACVSPVRVCMSRRPTLKPPSLPDRRAPPAIGTTSPDGPIPIRREKKRSTSPGEPSVNSPAFSRKKGRFSG